MENLVVSLLKENTQVQTWIYAHSRIRIASALVIFQVKFDATLSGCTSPPFEVHILRPSLLLTRNAS